MGVQPVVHAESDGSQQLLAVDWYGFLLFDYEVLCVQVFRSVVLDSSFVFETLVFVLHFVV